MTVSKRTVAAVSAYLLLAACEVGDGSDVGPKLPALPNASCKVVVLDDQGRGVVGAVVTVGGASAATGRNGRGDLLANPRGRLVVRADATNGAAVSGDQLADCRVALTIDGADLPEVLHVPDLPAAASAVLATGTQATTTSIVSVAGAILRVDPGTSVGTNGGGATVTVRLGDLQAQHLPGDPPAAGAWLFSRGLWIDPVDVTFSPAAVLDLPDELGLGAGTATLFHLDATTGEWAPLAATGTGSAGRIVATGVASGGLYAFAAPVAAATVSGRVVDSLGQGVSGALVRVDHLKTTTDDGGRFTVAGVPAALADGSPRSAAIELFAGGTWLPWRLATSVAVAAGSVDTGDLAFDTVRAGNVRVQQVFQGRALPVRPSALSSQRGDVAIATTSDDNGQVLFEDVPAEYFGFQDGRPIDVNDAAYGNSIAYLDPGRRWLDAYQFYFRRSWYLGARKTRTYVSDALGGGPLRDSWVVQGSVPGEGRAGQTLEGGTVYVVRDFSGRATASLRTARDGRVVVHAFSIEVPDGEHIEMPLQRALRAPLGAFDRHGLVGGALLGADPLRQHELRVTRRLSLQEWWDELVEGRQAPSSVPLDVDPAVTHADFVTGVPAIGGNLAASESSGPPKLLEKAGVVADLVPDQGGRIARDIALDSGPNTTFAVTGALLGAPAELDLTQLSLALALQQPSGRVVDVARALLGNHAAVGDDLVFTLPALTGSLAGGGWLALLDGSYPGIGCTLRCSTLVSLPRAALPSAFPLGAVTFGEFPTIVSPADGAVVPAAGFTVQFALPANAVHGMIELRSESGGETLLWQALVPRVLTAFPFVTLPQDVVTPLVAGRTFSLTVSAYFGDGRYTHPDRIPYSDLTTFWQSIGSTERGVTQVMRRTIQITTN